MKDRTSLRDPGLIPVWERVRSRLERHGVERLGRLRLPPLTSNARLALAALLDRQPGLTIDLHALESALRKLGIGDDLTTALANLGHPVSSTPQQLRTERRAAREAREAARETIVGWPEPWCGSWIDEVIRAGTLRGLDRDGAVAIVRNVRAVLDHLALTEAPERAPISRVDVAAQVLGDSHALDGGSRLEGAVTRALQHHFGRFDARTLWERAGVHLDLTSAPALTWSLPLARPSALRRITQHATELGIPLHLSQLALREHPIDVVPGSEILVVENPRVVEAAAQRRVARPLVAANGNPSSAVRLLLEQLHESGARLHYHGDFDAAGLAMCARMTSMGAVPWRMNASDYVGAVAEAEASGLDLPVDRSSAPPTPWDPDLRAAFDERRLVVHEERLLHRILVE